MTNTRRRGCPHQLLLLIIFILLLCSFTVPQEQEEAGASCTPNSSSDCDQQECINDDTTNKDEDNKKKEDENVFDVFGKWVDDVSGQAQKFLKKNVFDQQNNNDVIDDPFQAMFLAQKERTSSIIKENSVSIQTAAQTVLDITKLATNRRKTTTANGDDSSFDVLLTAARNIMPPSTSQKSWWEAVQTFLTAWDACSEMFEKAFGHLFEDKNHRFTLAMIFYYMEREEERKTFGWKRRLHRYQTRLAESSSNTRDVEILQELHEGLYLSQLSYANTVEDIQHGLKMFLNNSYELIYAKTEGFPGEPAHFLAIQKESRRRTKLQRQAKAGNSNNKSNNVLTRFFLGQGRQRDHDDDAHLDIIFVVRGTKELGDLLSDALLEATDFVIEADDDDSTTGNANKTTTIGKAHAGIAKAGQYLVDTHLETFETLLKVSGKRKLKLSLVGHSLGAGSAAIAAILFNRFDWIEATSVGYGCPALLDWESSQKTAGYITTVVNDADIVPRMSGASIANLLLDMLSYDWTWKAIEDVELLLDFIHDRVRPLLGEAIALLPPKETIMNWVKDMAEKGDRPYFTKIRQDRLEQELYAPGNCIHLYRDGSSTGGFSASYVPCRIFNEVEFSRTFLDDHLIPPGYHYALLQLLRSAQQDWDSKYPHDLLALPV